MRHLPHEHFMGRRLLQIIRFLMYEEAPVDWPDPADEEDRGEKLQYATDYLCFGNNAIGALRGASGEDGPEARHDDVEDEAGDGHLGRYLGYARD